MIRQRLPNLQTVTIGALFFTVLFMGPRLFSLDGDLGRHLTIGEYILQTGNIPVRDLFSHTRTGAPLAPHEWLAQVLFALSHRSLGLGGPVLWTAGLTALAFGLAMHDASQRTQEQSPLLLTLVTLGAAAVSSVHWLARPHMFTLPLMAAWAAHMEGMRRCGQAPLWRTAALMLLWVNLHGAFIVAFTLLGAYLAEALWMRRPLRLWLSHIGVALMATLANPVGWRVWEVVFGFLGSRYLVARTGEYQSPNFQLIGFWPFLLSLALLFFLTTRKKTAMPLSHALILTGWAALGLYSARNIAIFAVVALPVLAEYLTSDLPAWWRQRENNLRQLVHAARWQSGYLLLFLLLGTWWVHSPLGQAYNRYPAQRFPVAAVNWLEANPPAGEMFNYFDWGGYLLYRLWPEKRVFIDGQTDFYGEAFTREYERAITASQGWEDVMTRYQVQWAILPPDVPLTKALNTASGWETIYADETAIIFRRR